MNVTGTLHREAHPEPFRFLIKRDRDGRHRWSLYNASGTVVGRHTAGFPSELEARQDAQRVRDELADGPHHLRERAEGCKHRAGRGRWSGHAIRTARDRR
jgi:hypothetical protein